MELDPILGISISSLAIAAVLIAFIFKKQSGAKTLAAISNAIKQALPVGRSAATALGVVAFLAAGARAALAQSPEAGAHQPGGEANLKLPDLSQVKFLGVDGH